jgi:hypothetical protein
MTIQEFIKMSGMTHKQLSERFEIPKRTIEDWSRGARKCPDYVVKMMEEILQMKKYEVNFTDYETGATSPIDTVIKPDGYTADQYIKDCKENADDEWNRMLENGEVTLVEI